MNMVRGRDSSERGHSFFFMTAIRTVTWLSEPVLCFPAAAEWTMALFLSSRHSGVI